MLKVALPMCTQNWLTHNICFQVVKTNMVMFTKFMRSGAQTLSLTAHVCLALKSSVKKLKVVAGIALAMPLGMGRNGLAAASLNVSVLTNKFTAPIFLDRLALMKMALSGSMALIGSRDLVLTARARMVSSAA